MNNSSLRHIYNRKDSLVLGEGETHELDDTTIMAEVCLYY